MSGICTIIWLSHALRESSSISEEVAYVNRLCNMLSLLYACFVSFRITQSAGEPFNPGLYNEAAKRMAQNGKTFGQRTASLFHPKS
jgi:hypothetical protein